MTPVRKNAPRNSRPLRPRALAQRKLRVGLPPTVAVRTPPHAGRPRPLEEKANVTAHPSPVLPPPPPPLAPAPSSNALRLRGEYWEVRFGGASAMVEDCRGLRYVALLVQRAASDARPIHAAELTALASGREHAPIELTGRDELLDAAARKQLLDRLSEIAGERERACATEAFDRAEQLDDEYERIAAELSHASGGSSAGRRGAFADSGERARKAVAKAISEALSRIAAYKEVAALAEHLSGAIRKGRWLSYGGDTGWDVDFRPPLPRK